jgi:acyl-CoA synthetase (AMP-forming)/AMP-acid ligase II
VCRGYTDPALTAEAFDDDGWFRTGDVGHFRPDGHLVLTGRLKDIIIRKGENISAKEVEDVLHLHPAVSDVAVIALADAERGELCCAVVVLDGPDRRLSLDDVRQHCREHRLARFKVPERIEIVAAIPRNATGKALKAELVARYSSRGGGLAAG